MPERAPPSCAFGCLLDAHSSVLRLETDLVAEDDALCLALACRALRDAVLARYRPHTPAGTAAQGAGVTPTLSGRRCSNWC